MIWHIYDQFGSYFISRRRELAEPFHQSLLARASGERSGFRCGCCKEGPRMIPVKMGNGHYTLRRQNRDEPHTAGCPMPQLERMRFGPRVVYTEGMLVFDRKSGIVADSEMHEQGRGNAPEARYEDFVHFLQSQFAIATLETFAARNRMRDASDRTLINFSGHALLAKLRERFFLNSIVGGRKSLAVAMNEKGMDLYWGDSWSPLVSALEGALGEDVEFELRLPASWSFEGPIHTETTLTLPSAVVKAARGKVRAHNHVIGPPYFYVVVSVPRGDRNEAVFFYRVPASVAADSLLLVESEVERRALEAFTTAGGACLKPHVQTDLSIRGDALWPFALNEHGRLPNRPDVILYLEGAVRVIYVADSDDPVYWEKLRCDVGELSQLLGASGPQVRVVEKSEISNGSWRAKIS